MKRKNDFIMREVGGENLLVPLGAQVRDLNGFITLNGSAACLWELLATDRSLEELASAVAERFAVDRQTAAADVQIFLREIAKMGLLEP